MNGNDVLRLRELALQEVFRTDLGLAQFDALGRFFPDIALHYLYLSFDSFAHAEACSPDAVELRKSADADEPSCGDDLKDGGKAKEGFYRNAYSAAATADALVQKFLVEEYRASTERLIRKHRVPPKYLDDYLIASGTEEDRGLVRQYRALLKRQDEARLSLKGILNKKKCGDEGADLYDLFDKSSVPDARKVLEAFHSYTSSTRKLYFAARKMIPVRQNAKSKYKKEHPYLRCTETVVLAGSIIFWVLRLSGLI